MMEMKFSEIKPWHDIYVLQSIEEEVVNELRYDDKGKPKTLPSYAKIREMVLQRIEERKKEQ